MIKSRKAKLLIANILVYILLFSIFSFIIYSYVSKKQYQNVDEELTITKETLSSTQISREGSNPEIDPRVVVFTRDKEGNILNQSDTNYLFQDNEEKIEGKELNKIVDLVISGYTFRAISFNDTTSKQGQIIQLLINTSTEHRLLDNLLMILIFGGAFIIVLSIGASWYLTNKSVAAIIKSLKKQREFVENASHELRTPLTIIQSKLELLLRDPNAKVVDKLECISPALSETRRISRMVGNLLTLARADSNSTELEFETVNIKKLITEIIETYKEIGELEDKNLSYDGMGEENLICDKGRIHQLLIILLDNALKYTNNGGNIKIQTNSKDNKFIIAVNDDGIGIKEENRNNIFQRFFREDVSRTRETGGSGLGLSIANWIVEQHGGNIRCLPNKPRGTIMRVTLPARKISSKN
ncbi:MAG TPA: HAMP domain-containing sensor histidine kinase [Clostridiaceae bacterium]